VTQEGNFKGLHLFSRSVFYHQANQQQIFFQVKTFFRTHLIQISFFLQFSSFKMTYYQIAFLSILEDVDSNVFFSLLI